ncbi:MAG TPA: YbhB/YbcL family Raf kinase inhibitor-like protein [Acetivibrio thermocellus]|nr:YbhB/YbcL family Raf kinase inhibitor-like protein [Acetivibrio thermocellus]
MQNGKLEFECVGLTNNGKFPLQHTGRGEDKSPEFIIHNLSSKAKTIAITLDDIAHPIFGVYNHWVIWNIPATNRIPGGIPAGKTVPSLGNAVQGISYGRHRYAGPKPPRGWQHAYKFTIYVLDSEINLKSSARKRHLLKAIKPHIIQQGEIVGVFE